MIFFRHVFKNIWFTIFPVSIPVLIKWESPRRGISHYKERGEYGELALMYTSTLTWNPSCQSQFLFVETVILWRRSNRSFGL